MICNRCSQYINEDEYEQDGMCTECATDLLISIDEDIFDDYEDVYLEEWEEDLEEYDEDY